MKKLFLLTIMSLFIFSCEDDLVTPKLEIDNTEFSYLPNGGEAVINVDTNIDDWYYDIDSRHVSWIKAEKSAKGLKLIISPYLDGDAARNSMVQIFAGDDRRIIRLTQASPAEVLKVNATSFTVPAGGQAVEFKVNAKVDYEVILPKDVDWLSKAEGTAVNGEKTHTITVASHKNKIGRDAEIMIKGKGDFANIVRTISIVQNAYEPTYEKIAIVSGATTSFQPNANNEIEKAFDGNMATKWHSAWDNKTPNYFPIIARFNFAQSTTINAMRYLPDTSTNPNGRFKEIEIIAVPADGSDEYVVASYIFQSITEPTNILFTRPAENVTGIKVKVLSGYGSPEPGFAAIAEIEFFKEN